MAGAPVRNAHPLVHLLHRQLLIERMSQRELARRTGIARRTLSDWWLKGAVPNIMNMDACLQVFNLKLKAGAVG